MRLRLGASGAEKLRALGAIGRFCAAPQLHLDNPMQRFATATVAVLLGAVAIAGDSSRWIEVKGGGWEPDSLPFAQIEDELRPLVAAAAKSSGPVVDWKSYTFQYQGQRGLTGRKFVFINGFCEASGYHLSEQWVQVFDGGACFFRAKYDPQTRTIYDFEVNGVA